MTIPYLGDFPTGKTIYIPFHTFDSNDPTASVTMTGLAVTDIEIYRNGSTTQRASDSGYTLLDTDGIDFDGITGLHGFSIDTSDNTDAGFFAAGYDYWVAVSAITVDAGAISFWAAIFSIDNRGLLRPTTATRTLDVSATGEAGLDFDNIKDATGAHTLTNITVPTVTTVGTCTTNTDMRGTDSAALASVCTEARLSELDEGTAGKMANQIDIIQTDTTTDIPATLATIAGYIDTEITTIINDIATAQADLDLLTGVDGATLATLQGNYAPAKAGDEMDLVNAPNATAVTAIQNGLATLTKLLKYVQLLARSDAAIETDNATELTAINADGGSGAGNFSAQTDSVEAVRDRGDAAWITATGFMPDTEDGSSFTAVPWNAAWDAEVQSEVADALNAAIPGSPTAASINDYVRRIKYATCNRWDITEATGGLEIFDDADGSFATIAAAFTTLAGVTKRSKIL